MNRFIITEPSSCIGCHTCEIACTLAHPIVDGSTQMLSPANFKPRLKLLKTQNITSTVQCRHCEDAPCVNVCPTNALIYSEDTVQLLDELCIGCKTCVIACPFGAMNMEVKPIKRSVINGLSANSTQVTAHKCDLCVDREKGPACMEVCPTKAIHLVASDSSDDMLRQMHKQTIFKQLTGAAR